MTIQQQEAIVKECKRIADLLSYAANDWLQTKQAKRYPSAALELSTAADAMYTHLHTFNDLMGSDQGKPAFDDFNKDEDEDFQSDMNSLWDQPEPDYRERRRLI